MSKEPLNLSKLVEEKIIEGQYGRTPKPFNQFSPSMTGYCKRQMYNRKFSLTRMPRYVQGILHAGTVNHFWLEHHLPPLAEDRSIKTETRVRHRIPLEDKDFDLFIYGEADAVDSEGNVYDHKFTGNPDYAPKEKDIRQVNIYIKALDGVDTGQLEYVTRDGKFQDAEENTYIHTFEFDQEKFEETRENMAAVAEKVREAERNGTEKQNPFDKCDCYFCGNEEMKADKGPDGNIS